MERWILAVGYDKTTTQAAQQEWIKHGIYVVAVADMEAAKALLPRKDFILVAIFSSDPPLEQIAELRKIKPVHVLIVSDEDNPEKKQEALRLGVADYFVWPGSLEQSVEYGRTVIANLADRASPAKGGADEIEISGLRINAKYYTASVNGTPVSLTSREFAILWLLMSHPRKVFTHQMIQSQLWDMGYENADGKAVYNHMYNLRRKLKVDLNAAEYIRTNNGTGYKFDP